MPGTISSVASGIPNYEVKEVRAQLKLRRISSPRPWVGADHAADAPQPADNEQKETSKTQTLEH